MGWFDEDDDSDEDEQPQQQYQQQQHDNNDDEEEEDPLDAYMKSLGDTTATASSSIQRAERLDVEAQDEATSHWNNEQEQSDNHDDSTSIENEDDARQALDTTFHRAGGTQDSFPQLDVVQHETMDYPPFEKSFWNPADTSKGHEWRSKHQVTCHPGTLDPIDSFQECTHVFGDAMMNKIHFESPTLVQSQTLPVALSGRNALITASTGSGKTLAYAWPMLVHVQAQPPLSPIETGPMAIVLVPTRELALQVHKQVKTFKSSAIKSLAVTGGISNYHLLQDIKRGGGVHVVVATPGRFLDLLGKRGLSLTRVSFLILDEADKMLDMGFESQVTQILSNIRPDRQSLLLSATMGQKVERVARKWLQDPVRIAIGRTGESSQHVQQHVMVLPNYAAKKQWMMEMLPILANVGRTLVFCATRVECQELAEQVQSLVKVETLHGDKHQSDRNAALRAFSKGTNTVLIATDVAARGLDVHNVATVVNFCPAKNLDSHVHRIGRAGRLVSDSGRHDEGVAYTLLVTPKDADFCHVLVNAFEREGRPVSEELKALANKSRRSGNVEKRTRWNKSGLGYEEDTSGHYGPSSRVSMEPPEKRSRWG